MPYFSVLIGGTGKIKKAGPFEEGSCEYLDGFFTTCIFKADSSRDAEDFALQKIDNLWQTEEYKNLAEGSIAISVEEIAKINVFRFYSAKIVNALNLGGVLSNIPEEGHIFYSEPETGNT